MTTSLSPLPVQHFVDSNGNALSGGKVFTYAAGTTTKLATYTDSTGGTPNTNPIILNSRGECNIWLTANTAYKIVLSPSTDSDPPTNAIWTVDNIYSDLNFATPITATGGLASASIVNRFGRFLNTIDDGGCAGDGSTDDTVKFQALDAAIGSGKTMVVVGTIRLTSSISVASDLMFIDGGQLKPDSGVTITLSGALIGAYRQQIFSGAGAIKLGYLAAGPAIYPEWWGAKAGPVGNPNDSTAAIQAAINACADHDGLISFTAGCYNLTSGLTASFPFQMRGVGTGIGPSGATAGGGTVLAVSFATGDVLFVASLQGVVVRDMQFNSYVTRTSGACVHISGPDPGTNANSRIENVAFLTQYDCVHLTGVGPMTLVDACFFTTWVNVAVATDSFGSVEGGGVVISRSYFFGNNTISGGTVQQAAILAGTGYTEISKNWIVGANVGIIVDAGTGVPNAGIWITDNVMEEQVVESILMEQNTETEVSVTIVDNEFSQIFNVSSYQSHINIASSASDWVKDVNISRNTFNSFLTYSTGTFISVQAGKNVIVQGNTMNNNSASANPYAISIGTQPEIPVQVLDNGIIGFSAGKFYNTVTPANILVRDNNGIAFANLAPWANGSEVYVTDGKATGSTNPLLAGSGSGCLATAQRGGWYAPYGLT